MDYKEQFIEKFDELCQSTELGRFEVWQNFVTMCACSFNNAFGESSYKYEEREAEFEQCKKRLNGFEKAAELLAILTMALEDNPDQDFLGEVFQQLKLNDVKRGQFFTPYHISKMMARITCSADLGEKGWVSICDPCVGAGSMLIATANTYRELGINYQTNVLFVGQDIDRTVALMSYVQMTLLGCPGYVVVGNSLTNPIAGDVLFPDSEDYEIWHTLMFFRDEWQFRKMKELFNIATK